MPFLSCEIVPSQTMSRKRRTGSNLKFWRGKIQRVCFLDVSQACVASLAFIEEGKKRHGASLIPKISWTEVTFKRVRWGRDSNGSLSVPHAGAGCPTLSALRYTTAERSAVSFNHTCCLTAGRMRDEWVERGRWWGRGRQVALPQSEFRIAADEPRVPAGAQQWHCPILLSPAAQCVSVCVKEKEEEKCESQTRYGSASVHTCGQVWTGVWTSSTVWKCDGGCVWCVCAFAPSLVPVHSALQRVLAAYFTYSPHLSPSLSLSLTQTHTSASVTLSNPFP